MISTICETAGLTKVAKKWVLVHFVRKLMVQAMLVIGRVGKSTVILEFVFWAKDICKIQPRKVAKSTPSHTPLKYITNPALFGELVSFESRWW